MKRASNVGAGALLALTLFLAQGAFAETLSDFGAYAADGRNVVITSNSGQTIKVTAYGDGIVRLHAVRAGEAFYADDRYEMVDPRNHAAMVGRLAVEEAGDHLTISTAGADGVRIVVQKSPLRFAFYDKASGRLLVGEDAQHAMAWSGPADDVVAESFAPTQADEHFFGAGHGTFGRVAKLDLTGESVQHNYDRQAPLIVPFYLSTKGYGVFFNTTFSTRFKFGKDGRYELSADGKGGGQPQLDYYVIKGPEFPAILDRYTRLTGRPRLPQESIFGLQLSDKNFPATSTESWWREKINAHKQAGFPFDHQVNDNRWRLGAGDRCGGKAQIAFDTTRWPDPAGFAAWARSEGVTTTLDYNRCVSENSEGWRPGPPPEGYSFRAADIARVSDNASVPDWSNPAARRWIWSVFWNKALNPALHFPGDALWLDEPDEMESIPPTAPVANGWTWSELANEYLLLLHKAVGEDGWDQGIGEARRPWNWSRGATAGVQRYGHYWTGDTNSDYPEMQNQIRGMQAAGLAGFPYFNHDGGGYQGRVISDDLYQNWAAGFASLAPIWRPHGRGDTGKDGRAASRWPLDQDAATQAVFRRYATLRYTLMPYIYSLAHEAAATGLPMARAMVIQYRTNPRAYDHDLQYLWGPSLLVMPVVTAKDGAQQSVWLPAGDDWYDFWDDSRSHGSDAADKPVVTHTGETPVFVRAGAILPEYAYAQSVKQFDKSRLDIEVYKGKDGAFALYEDDGVTEAYRSRGALSVTRLAFTNAATRLVIAQPKGTYDGAPTARRYVVRLHGLKSPIAMRVNGAVLPSYRNEAAALAHGEGAAWDARRNVLSVVTRSIPVEPGGVAVTVEAAGRPYPAARD